MRGPAPPPPPHPTSLSSSQVGFAISTSSTEMGQEKTDWCCDLVASTGCQLARTGAAPLVNFVPYLRLAASSHRFFCVA